MEKLKQVNFKTVLLVFVLSVLTECAYTGYAYFVARGDLFKGPMFAGLIAIGKGVLVCTYTRKPIQISTLAVGQVIGTLITLSIIGR